VDVVLGRARRSTSQSQQRTGRYRLLPVVGSFPGQEQGDLSADERRGTVQSTGSPVPVPIAASRAPLIRKCQALQPARAAKLRACRVPAVTTAAGEHRQHPAATALQPLLGCPASTAGGPPSEAGDEPGDLAPVGGIFVAEVSLHRPFFLPGQAQVHDDQDREHEKGQ